MRKVDDKRVICVYLWSIPISRRYSDSRWCIADDRKMLLLAFAFYLWPFSTFPRKQSLRFSYAICFPSASVLSLIYDSFLLAYRVTSYYSPLLLETGQYLLRCFAENTIHWPLLFNSHYPVVCSRLLGPVPPLSPEQYFKAGMVDSPKFLYRQSLSQILTANVFVWSFSILSSWSPCIDNALSKSLKGQYIIRKAASKASESLHLDFDLWLSLSQKMNSNNYKPGNGEKLLPGLLKRYLQKQRKH